jgi:hypothetical protein
VSTAGRPRHGDQKRNLGERRRREIEQAVARGWSRDRTIIEFGVTEAEYDRVWAAMDEAVNTA